MEKANEDVLKIYATHPRHARFLEPAFENLIGHRPSAQMNHDGPILTRRMQSNTQPESLELERCSNLLNQPRPGKHKAGYLRISSHAGIFGWTHMKKHHTCFQALSGLLSWSTLGYAWVYASACSVSAYEARSKFSVRRSITGHLVSPLSFYSVLASAPSNISSYCMQL